MPKEVVALQIGLKGQDEAISKLKSLDELVKALNNKKIVLDVDTSSVQAFSKEVQKSIQLANQNMNAQARLLKQKNQELSVQEKLQVALAKQAEAQAKVSIQAEKTKQEAEKTAQAQAKVAAEAQKTAQAQVKAYEEAEKTKQQIEKTAQAQAKVVQEAEKTKQQAEKTAQAEAKVAAEAQKTATVEEKRKLLAEQMSAKYEQAAMSADSLSKAEQAGTDTTEQKAQAVDDLSDKYEQAAQSAKELSEIEKKLGKETGQKLDLDTQLSTEGFKDYLKNTEDIKDATVAATKSVNVGQTAFQQFSVSVKTASGDFQNFTYSVDTGTGAVYKMDNGMSSMDKTASKLSKGIGNLLKQFAEWAVVATLFYGPIQAFQDAVEELKKVDAELVNIQKVMGATASEMDQLSDRAFEVGSALGVAASDYLASVNKWAQAGYDSLSADLGELSVKTQKVGDVQEETANQFLLSVDAAYKYKGNIEQLTKVLDGANEISNNYATSVEKLAGGMGIVSSLAAQAGMEVQETMAAIGTITAVTQESGNSAARALRALILNIQGNVTSAIDEETGERWDEEDIAKTAAALQDLGVATTEYKNGLVSLRNPMEVIGDLSQKYRDGLISEIDLQEVVSALGGKTRSNQLQALISNFDTYEKMLDTYKESVGSADRELDIYLNSWEAKANRLQNQWVELADSMKASEISKGILDVGNAILSFANADFTPIEKWSDVFSDLSDGKISSGLLATNDALLESAGAISKLVIQIVAITAAMVAFKAAAGGIGATDTGKAFVSGAKGTISDIAKEFKKVPAAASAAKAGITGVSGALAGAKAGASAFGSATVAAFGPVAVVIGAVTIGILAFKAAVDNFVANDRFAKKMQEASDALEETNNKVDSLNAELQTTKDRINELNSKGALTLVEQGELEQLKIANSLLESQLEIEKEIQKTRAASALEAAKNAVNNGGFTGDQDALFSGQENIIKKLATGYASILSGPVAALGLNYLADKSYKRDWEEQLEALDEEMKKAVEENNEKRIEDLADLQADMMEQLQQELSSLDVESMMAADPEAFQEVLSNYQDLQFRLQAITNPLEAVATRLEQFEDSLDPESLEIYNQALKDFAADGKVTAQEVQKLADLFPTIKTLIDSGLVTWDDLASHFTSVANGANDAAGELENFSAQESQSEEEAKTLAESLSELQGKVSELTSAQEALATNGKLGLDQVISLMEAFPDLEDALAGYLAKVIDETQLREILNQKYQEETNNYKKLIIEKMKSSEAFYKSVILGNSEVVKKLYELGLTDLENYKTIEELKEAAAELAQKNMLKVAGEGSKERVRIYGQEAKAYLNLYDKMSNSKPWTTSGQKTTLLGSAVQQAQDFADRVSGTPTTSGGGTSNSAAAAQSVVNSVLNSIDSIIGDALNNLSFDLDFSSGSSYKGGSSGSTSSGNTSTGTVKSWYETEKERLDELVTGAKNTNQLLQKTSADSAQEQIKNLQAVQAEIHKVADAARDSHGYTNASKEVKELQLLWHSVGEEIEKVYQSMSDDLLSKQSAQEWSIDVFKTNRENSKRSMEEISADNAKIVAQYKDMQAELHDLAEYYRSLGYSDTDELVRNLSDKWREYQEEIESVYDSLSQAFEDYIAESDQQIKALERTTGTAGQQMELYTKRIEEARKAIAELEKTNGGGINDERIWAIQDQIWSDEDSKKEIQEGLWDELVNAVDKEFDKRQDEIDAAQGKLDEFNQKVADLDKELQEIIEPLQDEIEEWKGELEDALDDPALRFFNESLRGAGMSITEAIERYTEAIEEEKDALEKATDPLRKQIEGYYIVKPDGTIGGYVPGLEDARDDWQELLDKENERWEKEQEQHDEDQALAKKQLALTEAIKNLEQAQLDLETAKNERTVYTLKDGVWAWRADESAIKDAEEALEDAEQAKEDAQDELDWFKLEQAHNKLANFYKEQVELEQDKIDELNKQIEALERESEARQDYLNDQLDLWEDEKEAWEDHYNNLIENNEKEIEAWEEYYEKRKKEYDDDIKFWGNEVKRLQEQYDAWAEEWGDIQDAMSEDVRSIEEILADIAKYGTPKMKEQIDNVTDLLEKMGVALGDFNSGIGGSGGSSGGTGGANQSIIDQMKQNAIAWSEAQKRGDQAEMDRLDALNQQLANQLGPDVGAWRDGNGVWRDKNGNVLFTVNSTGQGTAPPDDYWNGGSSGSSSSSGGSSSAGSDGGGASTSDIEEQIHQIRLQAMKATESEKKAYFQQANSLAVSAGAQSIDYTPIVNKWRWYTPDGEYLFDRGGVARGRGVMLKDVEQPEVVLNPVLAADVLNPIRNQEFAQFAEALGIMFSSANAFAADLRATPPSVSNNSTDSHNVYINGVQIGESMMQKPLSETLSLLGIHREM